MYALALWIINHLARWFNLAATPEFNILLVEVSALLSSTKDLKTNDHWSVTQVNPDEKGWVQAASNHIYLDHFIPRVLIRAGSG